MERQISLNQKQNAQDSECPVANNSNRTSQRRCNKTIEREQFVVLTVMAHRIASSLDPLSPFGAQERYKYQ